MLDILFIVLVVFVFLIGINYNKEGFETQPDDLYQTEPIKSLTKKLNEYLQALISNIGTMVSTISDNITSKANEKINWIKGCVGHVQHCGKQPYWSRCSRRHCPRVPCGTSCSGSGWNRRCSTKYCTRCSTVYYGCTKWRSNCTPKYPLWKCSDKPSGYRSPPGFPSGWRR